MKKYNYNNKKSRHKDITDYFAFYKNDDYFDYIAESSSEFVSELDKYYDDYYGYDKEDYFNDSYNNLKHEKHRDLAEL